MALPGSGQITIQMIATELGVSLPLDLNASNVRALAGVPSGSIIMPDHFWGKSSYDPNPNEIDVGYVGGTDAFYGGGSWQGMNTVTVSGLSSGTSISLRFYFSGVNLTTDTFNTALEASVGVERLSGSPSGYGSGSVSWNQGNQPVGPDKSFDITVQNGDLLRLFSGLNVYSYSGFQNPASGDFSCSLEIRNLTSSSAVVGGGSCTMSGSRNGEA